MQLELVGSTGTDYADNISPTNLTSYENVG